MGVKTIVRGYTGWTSAHGVPHIGSAQSWPLRIFWTLIFLLCAGIFGNQMYALLSKYFSYETTVQTELKFEERVFPAVTMCSLNPFKNSSIYNNSASTNIAELLDKFKLVSSGVELDPDDVDFNQFINDSMALQDRARAYLAVYSAQYDDSTREELVLGLKDFVKNCAYNTKPCNYNKDFTFYLDPLFGVCYTFNHNLTGVYKSTRAGPLYGLRVLLETDQVEYISTSESAGVRVSIHGQTEEPFADAFGYNAAVGFTTSYGLKFIRTERLPAPYGECLEASKNDRKYDYKGMYTVEGCFRSCVQGKVKKYCTCSDPRFAASQTDISVFCGPNMISCMSNVSQSNDVKNECSSQKACPQPCEEESFGVSVSTALWPSEQYNPPDCDLKFPGKRAECAAWYGHNTLLAEVYYERMNYQLLTESEKYGMVNLISDTGGNLGLWMGVSVITVVEVISVFILLCMYWVNKDRGHDEKEQEEEKKEDDGKDKGKSPPKKDE